MQSVVQHFKEIKKATRRKFYKSEALSSFGISQEALFLEAVFGGRRGNIIVCSLQGRLAGAYAW